MLLVATTAWSASGRVVGPDDGPLQGASVCVLVAPNTVGLCTETDEQGFYSLPASGAPGIRVTAEGFLGQDIAAVDHEAPIRLERAASFELRVIDDADGAPVAGASVWIVSADGRRRGPIDLPGSGWLRMSTFPAGTYRFVVEASGYAQRGTPEIRLVPGGRELAEVRMVRVNPGEPPTSS